ncbi:MAG: ATP synthase F1 subunit epsilon [Candidatus Aminicenantales bacterium]
MRKEFPTSLHLKVITPQKLLVDKETREVFLPSLEGEIGILPGHRPLLASLGKGMLTFREGQKEEKFPVEGGFAEIHPDRVIVFTRLGQVEEEAPHEG